MKYELFIAIRHLRARSRKNIISIITFISVMGIMLGVSCLILVLAVMTGFTDELKDKMLNMNAHINIYPRITEYFEGYDGVVRKLMTDKNVVAASPFTSEKIQIRKPGEEPLPVRVKGIIPEQSTRVTLIEKYVVDGKYYDLLPGTNTIIIGRELMEKLGVHTGEEVQLIIPFGKVIGGRRVPKLQTMKIVAAFDSGMFQYDMALGYIHLETAQKLFNLGKRAYGLEVRIHKPEKADTVTPGIVELLGNEYFVQPWTSTNKAFFSAIKLEKYALFIILLLIVAVAGFNIVNSLLMKVIEKKREIGMLKAMGAQSKNIMRIFLLEGLIIGITGTFFGMVIGTGLCYLGNRFELLKVQSDVYYLSYLPLRILFFDVFLIICASIAISLTVTLIPSFHAARQNPVDAIRYE